MKNFVKLLCLIVLIIPILWGVYCANSPWVYLGNGIYMQKNSKKQEDFWKTAIFKTMSTNKRDLYEVDGVKVHHEITKYQAGCDASEVLGITYSKSYDNKNNLLEEYNQPQRAFSGYSGLVDGEVYYWAICEED